MNKKLYYTYEYSEYDENGDLVTKCNTKEIKLRDNHSLDNPYIGIGGKRYVDGYFVENGSCEAMEVNNIEVRYE